MSEDHSSDYAPPFHFEARVEARMRDGIPESEARRRARIEFGGLDQVKEDCRDARGTRRVEDIAQDLRFAMRQLTKQRSFALVATIVLALGIGVNTLIFSIVNALVLRPLPAAVVFSSPGLGQEAANVACRYVSC